MTIGQLVATAVAFLHASYAPLISVAGLAYYLLLWGVVLLIDRGGHRERP